MPRRRLPAATVRSGWPSSRPRPVAAGRTWPAATGVAAFERVARRARDRCRGRRDRRASITRPRPTRSWRHGSPRPTSSTSPGGDPDLIPTVMPGTAAWAAITDAHVGGAVLAGASAGAMAFASWTWTPGGGMAGLHGRARARRRARMLNPATWTPTIERFAAWAPEGLGALGLSEKTGVIEEPVTPGSETIRWRVVGPGEARWLAVPDGRDGHGALGRGDRDAGHPGVRTDRGWRLDPAVTFLNHGSYGACPEPVLAVQRELRDRLEAEPVRFLSGDLPGLLDEARAAVGRFLCADPEGLAFVPNATTGVNTVLQSLRFEPGDELLTDDHEYNATINAHARGRRPRRRTGRRRARSRSRSPAHARRSTAILAAVTERTRLVLVSHVTSPTALILPVAELVAELDRRGIDTLVDGAHAPGMVPVDVDGLGAAYWTGNGHKWLCGPKGTGVLWVRDDRRDRIHPLVVSHGANADARADGRASATSSTGSARATRPGTWRSPRRSTGWTRSRPRMAAAGRRSWPPTMRSRSRVATSLAAALGIDPPAPDAMLGSMAALPLAGVPRRSRGRGARRGSSSSRTGSRSRSGRGRPRPPQATTASGGSSSASPPSATTSPPTTSGWRTRSSVESGLRRARPGRPCRCPNRRRAARHRARWRPGPGWSGRSGTARPCRGTCRPCGGQGNAEDDALRPFGDDRRRTGRRSEVLDDRDAADRGVGIERGDGLRDAVARAAALSVARREAPGLPGADERQPVTGCRVPRSSRWFIVTRRSAVPGM